MEDPLVLVFLALFALAVLIASGPSAIADIVQFLERIPSPTQGTIRDRGVDRFHDRIVYAKIHEPDTLLRAFPESDYDRETLLRQAGAGTVDMLRLLRRPGPGDCSD